jgi:hypothetical protein
MRSLFEQAKAIYAPEGKYMAGIEAGLERGEKKAVAGGMQGLAAAGLAGTSMMGGLSKRYQEEVAQPALARATTARLGALSGILSQEAGMEGSMAERTSTTTSPLARTYGGGGGGSSAPAGPVSTMASRQKDRAAAKAAAPSTSYRGGGDTKAKPLSLSIPSYSPAKKTGQVYFGAATFAKPEAKPLSTSAYGMKLGMNNYLNFGN